MSLIPQVLVTLDPQGGLQMELAVPGGLRRKISLRRTTELGEETVESTLLRVLHAQAGHRTVEIGTDGAPTERQIQHWERHSKFARENCPFCQAEGRLERKGRKAQPQAQPQAQLLASYPDGTQIRRLTAKAKEISKNKTQQSLEELGL